MLYNETPRSSWTVSEANYTVPSYTFQRRVCCIPAAYALSMSRASSLKLVYGLLQTANSWANAGVLFGARVGRMIAFESIKLINANVLCTIFDINYHPNIAHINMQGTSVLVLT